MSTKTFLCCWGLCVVGIFFSACGPLVPLSYDHRVLNDSLFQTIETDEATLFLEFTESRYGHHIFDLEVINHSPSEMFVAPQFVSYYSSRHPFKPLANSTDDVHRLSASNSDITMKRHFANSPERTQKMYREKMISDARKAALLVALAGAALTIYDAEKDEEDSKKEKLSKKDKNEAIARDVLVSVAVTASDFANEAVEEAKHDEYEVPYDLFPESTVQPGGSVRGKIFILKETYRYQRIVVPVGNIDYVFDFRRAGARPIQFQSQHHRSVDAQRK